MEIIIGKTAGFCFGVNNAVIKAKEELKKNSSICCLGELVHNKQVTQDLIKQGMNFIDDIGKAKNRVIIRSHGVEKDIYEKAGILNLELIDLTCPKVLHIHKIAQEYANRGYYIFLIGKKEHPEMIGTISFCGSKYYVLEDETEVESAIQEFEKTKMKKLLVISQTTYSLNVFNSIAEKVERESFAEEIEIENTICNATQERQEETEEIAKQVELMIVIGGKHSSNSSKLYDLSRKYCEQVFFVETEDDFECDLIKNVNKVGIMAGASTPQESIEKVVEKVKKMC